MALRKYRELEAQSLREDGRQSVKMAARQLVTAGNLTRREQEALRLYFGLEDNEWRTHEEVAHLMHLSIERVRQLLLPSKTALSLQFTEKVPWRTAKHTRKRHVAAELSAIRGGCSDCKHSKVKISKSEAITHRSIDVPDVILQGLPIFRCDKCDVEECPIPQRTELYEVLSRALLCKSDLLKGPQLRFLRRVAGLKVSQFAERLNVASQTVQKWESLETLRFANELASRIVLASLIFNGKVFSNGIKLQEVIRERDATPQVINIEWLESVGSWRLSYPTQ